MLEQTGFQGKIELNLTHDKNEVFITKVYKSKLDRMQMFT